MTTYSPTIVPDIRNAGLSAQLTDIKTGSKIDILRLLGRAAKKVIIEVKNGHTIDIVLNSAHRKTVAFKSGVIDIDGNTSALPEFGYAEVDTSTGLTIPVKGADNVSDRQTNLWVKPGLSINVASGASGASTWNSYDSYGEIDITSIEIVHSGSGSTELTCTFVA